jgi:hypothetical protein
MSDSSIHYPIEMDPCDPIGTDFVGPTRANRIYTIRLIIDPRDIIGSLFPELR